MGNENIPHAPRVKISEEALRENIGVVVQHQGAVYNGAGAGAYLLSAAQAGVATYRAVAIDGEVCPRRLRCLNI